MIKLKIISVGKTKEEWLNEAIAEYQKRLSRDVEIEFLWCKSDEHLLETTRREAAFICLDAQGLSFTSEQFADFLHTKILEGGSRLAFIIGGPEGLPPALKNPQQCLSLSPLTLTHQMARLILVEQIYRAFEISKGTKYHK